MRETDFDWSDRDDQRYINYLEETLYDIIVGEGLHIPQGFEKQFKNIAKNEINAY